MFKSFTLSVIEEISKDRFYNCSTAITRTNRLYPLLKGILTKKFVLGKLVFLKINFLFILLLDASILINLNRIDT